MLEKTEHSFGDNLRAAIKNRGMTYAKAAEEIGVSLSFVNQLMRGESTPSLEMLLKITKALGVDANTLLGESEKQPTQSDLIAAIVAILPALNDLELRAVLSQAEDSPSLRKRSTRAE